jgi:hypothetical protein
MRTNQELALMEIATADMRWEGENDSPTGSYALVTIDDETRATPCEDSDANDWLQSTSGTTHYVIQWDSNGQTWITEHDNSHDATAHLTELDASYYAWVYDDLTY